MTALNIDTTKHRIIDRKTGRKAWVRWGLGALLSVALALFSYRYLPKLAFGAPMILANPLSRPWLYLHIAGATHRRVPNPAKSAAR